MRGRLPRPGRLRVTSLSLRHLVRSVRFALMPVAPFFLFQRSHTVQASWSPAFLFHTIVAYYDSNDNVDSFVRVQSLVNLEEIEEHAGLPRLDFNESVFVNFVPGATAAHFRLLHGVAMANGENDDIETVCALHMWEKKSDAPWQLVHEFTYPRMDSIDAWISLDSSKLATSIALDDLSYIKLRIYTLETETLLCTINISRPILSFGWSPDGLHVIFVDTMKRAREYSIATGGLVRQFLGASHIAKCPFPSLHLPIVFIDEHVELLLQNGNMRVLGVQQGTRNVMTASASPDGMALLFFHWGGRFSNVSIILLV